MVDSIRWPRFTVETARAPGPARWPHWWGCNHDTRSICGVRTGCGRKPGLSGPAPGPSLGAGTGWRKVYTPWRKAAGRRIRLLRAKRHFFSDSVVIFSVIVSSVHFLPSVHRWFIIQGDTSTHAQGEQKRRKCSREKYRRCPFRRQGLFLTPAVGRRSGADSDASLQSQLWPRPDTIAHACRALHARRGDWPRCEWPRLQGAISWLALMRRDHFIPEGQRRAATRRTATHAASPRRRRPRRLSTSRLVVWSRSSR